MFDMSENSVKKQKIAVFDVDGTIFRSSLFIELVKLMITEGVFPKEARMQYEEEYEKWQNREGGYADYINAMIDTFYANIKGVAYGDFRDLSKKVIDMQSKHTYRYSRDLLKKLKEEGYFLLAVSHSPKTILDLFCNEIGFDKSYGVVYEIGAGDKLTGNVVDEHLIFNKANIVKRVLKNENLTLEDSVIVGDTEGDIQMLELADNPICFNPNSTLYKQAKIRGWSVVIERKDVVYKIQ